MRGAVHCVAALALGAGAATAIAPSLSFAQPPPQFEVASIRQHEFPPRSFRFGYDNSVPPIRISGDRITVQSILQGLVAAAYNVKMFQVIVAPRWSGRGGEEPVYDVAAKFAEDLNDSLDRARVMLQALVTDRFKLKLHREKRVLPVYDLVAGKNGAKLRAASDPNGTARPVITASGKTFRLRFSNASIANLIFSLAPVVDLPVLDRTGLTGTYDFTIEYDRGARDSGPDDGTDDHSIFSALQSQLGLKLVASREPIEVLVIDQAAEPSAN